MDDRGGDSGCLVPAVQGVDEDSVEENQEMQTDEEHVGLGTHVSSSSQVSISDIFPVVSQPSQVQDGKT